MRVGLILLPLSSPPSGRKILSFGPPSSRYCDFSLRTSIHQKCHLIGQKHKELKNLSIGREHGKASQNCKNTSSPLTLSALLLSLQKRPSVLKEHSIFKSFGHVSSVPQLEGWIVPSWLSQVMISGTGSYFRPWLQVPSEWDH